MTARSFPLLVLALLLSAGCADSAPASDPLAPQFAKKPAPAPGLSLALAAVDGNGVPYAIAGDAVSGTFTNGECGVSAVWSITEVIADIGAGGTRKAPCYGRRISIRIEGADPVLTSTHIKLQRVKEVTGTALVDGGFNNLVGVGGCDALRFNQNFGADRLQATRLSATEWLVETRPGLDRAACIEFRGSGDVVLAYYSLPFRMVVTELQ